MGDVIICVWVLSFITSYNWEEKRPSLNILITLLKRNKSMDASFWLSLGVFNFCMNAYEALTEDRGWSKLGNLVFMMADLCTIHIMADLCTIYEPFSIILKILQFGQAAWRVHKFHQSLLDLILDPDP